MYVADSYSKFALPPSAYVDAAFAKLERDYVLSAAWYPIASADQLAVTGANVVANYLDIPIVVRNFGSEVVAMRNVCAHRACIIVDSNTVSEQLRCPYHGWEYGSDGLTRKIPAARNFPHFCREDHRLEKFPLERCGDLWFVRLSASGPTLNDYLGSNSQLFSERLTAPNWKPTMTGQIRYEANWKLPIEGSLESYHVPFVHAETLGHDPGEESSEHTVKPTETSFITGARTESLLTRLEDWALRRLGCSPTGVYQHHHIFPNLMVTVMDTLTLVMVLNPTAADRSVARIWQFGRQPSVGGMFAKNTSRILGRLAAKASLAVLEEDRAVFTELQVGLKAAVEAPHGSQYVTGRCEERIHAFQQFIAGQVAAAENVS